SRPFLFAATPTTEIHTLSLHDALPISLGENAREVFELGKRLHARLSTLGGHVDGLGRALSKAVAAYNQTVGSLESRVLVTARRFEELGLVDGDLDRPSGVEEQARPLASAELTADLGGAAAGAGNGAEGDAGTPAG